MPRGALTTTITVPRYTLDRFEGPEWAVLEDEQGRTFRVPGNWLPFHAREGDVLDGTEEQTAEGVSLRFQLNPAAKEERLATARRLRDSLARGPKGDVSL